MAHTQQMKTIQLPIENVRRNSRLERVLDSKEVGFQLWYRTNKHQIFNDYLLEEGYLGSIATFKTYQKGKELWKDVSNEEKEYWKKKAIASFKGKKFTRIIE
jgi:hypothetical protein